MAQVPPITLPPSYVEASPPPSDNPLSWHLSPFVPAIIDPVFHTLPVNFTDTINFVLDLIDKKKVEIDAEDATKSSEIHSRLDEQLAAQRLDPAIGFNVLPDWFRDYVNVVILAEVKRKAAEVFSKEAAVHLRENPLNWDAGRRRELMSNSLILGADPQKLVHSWEASYRAAVAARLTQQEHLVLIGRRDALEPEVMAAHASAEALKHAHMFRAPVSSKFSLAQVFAVGGTIAVSQDAVLTLQSSIRAAITALAELAAGTASGFLVGVSALVYSSKLGNGELPERFAVSTELVDMLPDSGVDLHAIAAANGTLDLPYRLGSKLADDGTAEIIVIPTDGIAIPRGVRVIAAKPERIFKRYHEARTPDIPARTLLWTPAVNPQNTVLGADIPTVPPVYEGATVKPIEVRIDIFPDIADSGFEDYIFVFPVESGLPPLYLVFKSARYMPGVVSGQGQPVVGRWLDAVNDDGAPIPSQIADQLRGREFSSFDSFRRAFWKAVGDDVSLHNGVSKANLSSLQRGAAAEAPPSGHVGARDKLELHHVTPIGIGGSVYDVDNLIIYTPRRHIEIHSTKGQ